MSQAPVVSVVMPAYDAAATIREAIDSALAQSLSDLEVLVVDDGSRDATARIVASYTDPRVRLLRNPANLGIPASRQRGADRARGRYLAVLDSDDVAHPDRFEKQAAYLDAHPRCGVVGSWARIVSREGRFERLRRKPADPQSLRARMLFTNLVKDATAMTRTRLVREHRLREEYPVCELVDLWQRISARHDVANLPEALTTYREHEGGVTKRRAGLMREMKLKLVAAQLRALGVEPAEGELGSHVRLCRPNRTAPDAACLVWVDGWFRRLGAANRERGIYPEPAFRLALGEYWWKLCKRARRLGTAGWGAFWSSRFALPALRHELGWYGYTRRNGGRSPGAFEAAPAGPCPAPRQSGGDGPRAESADTHAALASRG